MTNYKILHYLPSTAELGLRTQGDMDVRDGRIAAINQAFFDGDKYKEVANISAKDLDDVFRKTNHINFNWLDGLLEGDEAFVKSAKSTSVGDIIFDLDSGSTYSVSDFGFTQLS